MTKFRIGHTGITWGYSPDTAEAAVKDVAELGYRAYETIAGIIERYEEQYGEGFDALLARYGIPLSGTYLPVRFESPDQTRQDVEQAIVWAKRAKELGATTVIVQAGSRLPEPFTEYDKMAEAFNEVGRRVMNLGMIAVIHPHTGTLVETRAEIDAILTRINSDLIGFGPDNNRALLHLALWLEGRHLGQMYRNPSLDSPQEVLALHKHLHTTKGQPGLGQAK